jgi:nitrate/TMAO reductase-like tetraheme cytochrome c subunit
MGFLKNLWLWVSRPSPRFALGTLVVVGGIGGVLFWGAFNWALEASSTLTFCISCHEMRSTVYEELQETIHFKSPSGVRAICADCHVPKNWFYKVARKIRATFNELPKHFIGYIDTREKFEAHRLAMAQDVWAEMKASDSRECRNCHSLDAMDLANQRPRARNLHKDAMTSGETCIDCHKGIAHKHVQEPSEEKEEESEGFSIQ